MKINNKGLTIVELIVALGVMAVLMVFILQFFDQQKKMAREYEREVEQKIDTLLADKLVLKDFRAATPSINQLFVPDDNNNNFFDYEPDINTAFYKGTQKNRIITLNADSSNKIFYLLVVDQIKKNAVFMEPVVAYSMGAQPPDMNTETPITFIGLNAVKDSNSKGILERKNENLVDPKTLVYVDSSAPMELTTNNKIQRSAAYIGHPDAGKAGNILAYSFPLIGTKKIFEPKIYSKDPNNQAIEVVIAPSSFDEFLKNLPPAATAGSNIRLLPVKLVRYSLVEGLTDLPCKTKCSLKRHVLQDNVFTNEVIVIQDLKSITFSRDDIATFVLSIGYVQNK